MKRPINKPIVVKTVDTVVNVPTTLVKVAAVASAANLAINVKIPAAAYLPITKVTTVRALETMPAHFKTL